MKTLSERLKERARALGLADAEVARRSGLSERRYGNYVSGIRQPDYDTLMRICATLAISPNEALGWSDIVSIAGERERLLANLTAVTSAMSDSELKVAVALLDTLSKEIEGLQRGENG